MKKMSKTQRRAWTAKLDEFRAQQAKADAKRKSQANKQHRMKAPVTDAEGDVVMEPSDKHEVVENKVAERSTTRKTATILWDLEVTIRRRSRSLTRGRPGWSLRPGP